MSSLTSGEADCSSLLDVDSCLDPGGLTSPQHGAMAKLRRSPIVGHANLGSPGTPDRVFRHNSFSGLLLFCHSVIFNLAVELLLLVPRNMRLFIFEISCSVFKVHLSLNPGGLALTSKTPHAPDSSPDICRFQPSPSYTLEVCPSHKKQLSTSPPEEQDSELRPRCCR